MEKELGFPKPGDLLFGVIDVFAILIPGVIAAALIVFALGDGKVPEANTLTVSGLLIAGWVLGHVVHGIGSWLDPVLYDRLFKPREAVDAAVNQGRKHESSRLRVLIDRLRVSTQAYLHKNDDLYRLATQVTDVPRLPTGQAGAGVPAGIYQWSRAWLSSHSPKSTSDVDRLEADSKLFRSLAILLLIAIPVLIAITPGDRMPNAPDWWKNLARHPQAVIVLAVMSFVFSLWRYCDLRNKMVRLCYLNYIQLRLESRTDR